MKLAHFQAWMEDEVLPLWATQGVADRGHFVELLDEGGRIPAVSRRARVQVRQAWVYCRAGIHGWEGDWRTLVARGMTRFWNDYARPDGLYRTLLAADGAAADDTATLYDQAFIAMAMSECWRADIERAEIERRTDRLMDFIQATRLPVGGWREDGPEPYQANAHMHLLECAMAWEDAGGDPRWEEVADHIVELCLNRFIDPETGWIREVYDETWRPRDGRMEPGHQFEWAWLLRRYALRRSRNDIMARACSMYERGRDRIAADHGVAVNALNADGSVRDASARLWPQAEWARAALAFAGPESSDTSRALDTLGRYLKPSGLWFDTLTADGALVPEPAPASTLYHLMGLMEEVLRHKPPTPGHGV